jgi:hypothetical protein
MDTAGSFSEGIDPDVLAAAFGVQPDPKAMRIRLLRRSSSSPTVQVTPQAARPTVAPVAPDAQPPAAALPAGPDFSGQRAKIEALLEELNQPKDLSALQAEGKRRGERGNTDMLLALAAQQAGQGFEPVQQTMLKQAMAARDPMKFTGGIVNDQGQVIEDPYFKQQEQRAMYERRLAGLDRGENTAALAAAKRAQEIENARMLEAGRNERAGERNALLMTLKSMGIAAKGAGKDGGANPGKTLTPATMMKLGEMEQSAGSTARLLGDFQDKFAGGKGYMMERAGQIPFIDTDAEEWWRNYRKEAELVQRHNLFGATLTGSEGRAWRAADIAPDMKPATIRANLQRRSEIEKNAFENMVRKLQKGGHNAAEPFGVDMNAPPAGGRPPATPAAPAAAPPAAAGVWSVKVKGQ